MRQTCSSWEDGNRRVQGTSTVDVIALVTVWTCGGDHQSSPETRAQETSHYGCFSIWFHLLDGMMHSYFRSQGCRCVPWGFEREKADVPQMSLPRHQPYLWCYGYGPKMARASSCQRQPTGSRYWSCHQHFTASSCQPLAWESSNQWKEAGASELFREPGNTSQPSLLYGPNLALWPFCRSILQEVSWGRDGLAHRPWILFFSKQLLRARHW